MPDKTHPDPPVSHDADEGGRMSVRARRAERARHAKRETRKPLPGKIAKSTAIAIGVAILLVGGVWAFGKLSALTPEGCKWHEHATFRVVVDGQELGYRHSRFDMSAGMPMAAHLHQPNDYQIHLEGRCADVQRFFSYIDTDLGGDYVRLDNVLHGGRELRSDGNNTLQFFLYHNVGENWTWDPYPELPGHQLRDQQRMLVLFGNYTQEEIVTFQSRVPAVAGS